MRILIQVRGGAVRSVAVEADTGPVRVMLWDHDNIEAGEGFDEADDFPHDILEPGDFDDLLAAIDSPASGEGVSEEEKNALRPDDIPY